MSVGVRFKYARTLEVLATLEGDHDALKKSTTAALAARGERIEALEDEVRKHLSEGNDLRDIVRELRAEVAAGAGAHEKQQELDALQQRKQQEIDALRQQIEEERARALLRDQELSQALSASQQQVSDLQRAMENLTTSFESERQEAALDSQSKASLQQDLERCRSQLAASQAEAKSLRQQLGSLKSSGSSEAQQEAQRREAAERAKLEMQELLELAQRKLSEAQRTNKVLQGSRDQLNATVEGLRHDLEETSAALSEVDQERKLVAENLKSAVHSFEDERKRMLMRIQELERELQASGGSKFRKFVELKAHTKKVEEELSNLREMATAPPGAPPATKAGGRRLKAASQRRRPEEQLRRYSSSTASDMPGAQDASVTPPFSAGTSDEAAGPETASGGGAGRRNSGGVPEVTFRKRRAAPSAKPVASF